MRGLARLAALLAAAALVAGCFEGKADFSLNPDGTGKVVGELLFPSRAPWLQKRYSSRPADPNAAPEPAPDPEEDMRECVAATIKRSVGIDAWKDVSFQRAADGRVQFKGTAYFKDLSKVRIYPDDRTRISFGPDGTTALLLILNRAKPVTEPPKPAGPTSGEDISRRLKEIRDRYQQTKSTVTTELPGMKVALVFHSSGTLEESRGLEQQGPTLSYAVEGGRIVQAMEAQMTDGTVIKQWALAGKAPSPKEMMNEKVFGAKGEVWARWKGPFGQRFDYQAEMAAAKKAQPAMIAKLGLEKPRDTSPRPPSAPSAPAAPKNSPAPKKDAGPAKSPALAPKGPPSLSMPAGPPAIPTPLVPLL
jgi:hypothetical protein